MEKRGGETVRKLKEAIVISAGVISGAVGLRIAYDQNEALQKFRDMLQESNRKQCEMSNDVALHHATLRTMITGAPFFYDERDCATEFPLPKDKDKPKQGGGGA